MKEDRVFYFGYLGDGHYLYESGKLLTLDDLATPFGYLDGELAPDTTKLGKGWQCQGLCSYLKKDGWTAVAFWDRTGDGRFNSNSVFIANYNLSFEGVLRVAERHFPQVFQRLENAGIKLVQVYDNP